MGDGDDRVLERLRKQGELPSASDLSQEGAPWLLLPAVVRAGSVSGGPAGAAGDRAPVRIVAVAEPPSLGDGDPFVLAEHPDEAELVAEGSWATAQSMRGSSPGKEPGRG